MSGLPKVLAELSDLIDRDTPPEEVDRIARLQAAKYGLTLRIKKIPGGFRYVLESKPNLAKPAEA